MQANQARPRFSVQLLKRSLASREGTAITLKHLSLASEPELGLGLLNTLSIFHATVGSSWSSLQVHVYKMLKTISCRAQADSPELEFNKLNYLTGLLE